MNLFYNWPVHLHDLLFDSDASEIYRYIQTSANASSNFLVECITQKEIEDEQSTQLSNRIKDCLRIAGEVRFALSTVDNRLRRVRNANPRYRQFAAELSQKGQKDKLSLLLEIYENRSKEPCPYEIESFVRTLAPDINLSLMYRVDLSELWDDILIVNRELHVQRLMTLSHRVTELALQLRDSESIQKVRKVLSQLDLKESLPDTILPSNVNPKVLKQTLEREVKLLDTSKQHIIQLDAQRAELKQVYTELTSRLEHTQPNEGAPQPAPVFTHTQKGMHIRPGARFDKRRHS